ncbi:MAG TPA: hypothetical protein VIM46_02070 [Luteolibacter sp.]
MPAPLATPQDAEHLKLLAIFHYVLGGLAFLGSLIGLLYVGMGVALLRHPMVHERTAPPLHPGTVLIVMGLVVVLLCIALGVCKILAGRWITARKNRTFCLVVAGIECLGFPLGTALGIFSFVVLLRPSVASMFERAGTDHEPGLNA